MRTLLLSIFTLFTCTLTYAQDYAVSSIQKELLPYASAVVRNEEITIEVKDLNTTVYHYKQAVTVLNKSGDEHADILVWYDKNRKVKYIKGVIYDEFGKNIGKFSERNFNDFSSYDGFSMFSDHRVKHHKPAVVNYPYTIEYEYELNTRQSLFFPEWRPNGHTSTAVEKSTYRFICKPDFNIRYKEFNYTGTLKTDNVQSLKTYTWEASNLKATRKEPLSPDPAKYQTIVKIVPEKFSYLGYDGAFTSWNGLGKWFNDKLLVARTSLPPATISYIQSLTDTITSPKLKAKAIYEYMQRKSRYVSIQVGIGGLQPFTASEVDMLNYGDCKGLVNYTQALLKAVNIPSYYCMVEAGDMKKSFMPDFASVDQGNHVILCLPFKNDTTWLECTNKNSPFGFLGDFTDDRLVLACTPEGGKLMRTPKYTSANSKQIRKAILKLNADGELTGNMTTTFEGWQYNNRTTTPDDIKEEIKKTKQNYSINNMEIENLHLKAIKNIEPVNNEEIKFSARDYATISDGRYFFLINLANRNSYTPREVRNRTTDVYINRGYTDIDEITYEIPAGYKLDSHPLQVSINKPFGKFTVSTAINGNQITYKRKLELIDGTYAKEKYNEVIDFYQSVEDADNYKAVLVKAN